MTKKSEIVKRVIQKYKFYSFFSIEKIVVEVVDKTVPDELVKEVIKRKLDSDDIFDR